MNDPPGEDPIYLVFEDWNCFVRCLREAEEAGDFDLFSEALHSGHMAILVDGIPRIISGSIN